MSAQDKGEELPCWMLSSQRDQPVPPSGQVVLKAQNRILPGFEPSPERNKFNQPFFFIQAADPQFGLIVNYGDGTINDQYPNITWEREIQLCNQAVDRINQMNPKPAFFIVCGDLTDAWPKEYSNIKEKQIEDFMRCFGRLDKDIPLVCVCGNHDVGNTPTVESIQKYKSDFGDDYFSFFHGGVHFMVLNSQYYADRSLVEDLAAQQDQWLDNEMAKFKANGCKYLVVFQHIPWFLRAPDEGKDYFNVDEPVRTQMLQKLHDGGVNKIFCGHYHRNAGGFFKDMELIITTAIGCQIGNDPHGMRVVKVTDHEISHTFHPLEDFPRKIDLPH